MFLAAKRYVGGSGQAIVPGPGMAFSLPDTLSAVLPPACLPCCYILEAYLPGGLPPSPFLPHTVLGGNLRRMEPRPQLPRGRHHFLLWLPPCVVSLAQALLEKLDPGD